MAVLESVELRWCKLLGEPRLNYNEDGKEWSTEFLLTQDHVDQLEADGFSPEQYLKKVKGSKTEIDKTEDGKYILVYRRNELDKDGNPNKRVNIIDGDDMPWEQDKLIGNGSVANVQYNIYELPAIRKLPKRGKLAVIKMMVTELVKYDGPGDDEIKPVEGGTVLKEDWSEE